ncbi:MAG: hypothetical protein RLY31_1244 [Bacteroidota bacterium]|jgi:membrane dipeptidase
MFIFDAHLDLSMNALEWNRDLRLPVDAINARETGKNDKPDRGRATVSLPALRAGNVGLVVATQIARHVAPDNPLPGWHSPQQAWAHTQAQLAWYREMEKAGEMMPVTDLASLERCRSLWEDPMRPNDHKPVGYILSLEGADSLVDVDYLDRAYEYGLRAVGPAHYGPGRYADGTDADGPIGPEGLALLRRMEERNFILDATHLCDQAFWQALDHFNGPVWASHNNCRALVPHQRQFSDEQLRALIRRGAVVGAAFDAWMLVPGWVRNVSTPQATGCTLDRVADHIDHICQLAGNALHVGIGSDLDGGFGREQCPADLTTVADLRKLEPILRNRGYDREACESILHGNWFRFLQNTWS